MSSQPPLDASQSQQPVATSPYEAPGRSTGPSKYIPLDKALLDHLPPPAGPLRQPAYLYPPPSTFLPRQTNKWPGRGLALAGLLVGIGSILLWFFPVLGDLLSISGITLSLLGWYPPTRKWMAMLGLALSLAALLLGLCDSTLGVVLLSSVEKHVFR